MNSAVDARVAIIDTADDTRPWISQLKSRGVQVVIRYLARGRSHSLPNLRIIDNGTPGTSDSEAARLIDHGFGLLLVYEWQSNNPAKFVFGLDEAGNPKTGPQGTDSTKAATSEADADSAAALSQAAAIGHPNAPIYFTIDFDLSPGSDGAQDIQGNPVLYSDGTPVTNDTVVSACTAYFQRLNDTLGKARLGIYAGGWASERLCHLVTYSWVAQSPGFTATARYLRDGTWHLFQQRDWAWFLGADCSQSLDVDTDIQNPAVTDIGAVGRRGSFLIQPSRTQAVFDMHYVATQSVTVRSQKDLTSAPVTKKSCHNGKPITVTAIARNCSVRVLNDDGTWLTVDMDEDGVADGYAPKNRFVANIKQTPDYHPAVV